MHFRILILIISFFITNAAFSNDISTHFKKITNASDKHTMKGIDFICTINLDKRPEKFESCIKQFAPYGITPYRFSAVNGWELSAEALNDLGIRYNPAKMTQGMMGTCYLPQNNGKPSHELIQTSGRNYYSHCMSRGAIGIVLSHLSILQYALDKGFSTIWVMEDDIEILKNPHSLSSLIEQLDATVGKNGWDILFTDRDTKNNQGEYIPCSSYAKRPDYKPAHPERFAIKQNINATFRKIGARYGAYSMIVRKSGMEKILNFLKKHRVFLPYDMEFYLPESIKMYTVQEDVVSTQIRALSDNGAPRYLEKERLLQTPTVKNTLMR